MNLTLDKFKKKRDDTYQKNCEECLTKRKANVEKNKCEHGRRRYECRQCGGSQVCTHGKQKNQCKMCADPVNITIYNMLKCSKSHDKKYKRYDPVNYIDYCFVENLLDDYPRCYYEDCKCELQLIKYEDNLATIERLDNDVGHIKSNCVICCMKCNKMKKSNK